MTEVSPNQTLRSFCFADRPFALKANLRLRVSYRTKPAGQTACHFVHCKAIAFAMPINVLDLAIDPTANFLFL